jgi:hypothetical protein
MSPFGSENLTDLVGQEGNEFIAIHSPRSAEDKPNYREMGRFKTQAEAEEFLASTDWP